jgi:predicted transcriptional regulator
VDANTRHNLAELTTEIVAAYVSHNATTRENVAMLITDVYSALAKAPTAGSETLNEPPEPAVPVRKSVTPDHIICLEDGMKLKALKRHLRSEHRMTPQEYREKWGLKSDYPMVAPNYAKARSQLAKAMGLGRKAAPGAGGTNSSGAAGPRHSRPDEPAQPEAA